tara:strand:- start:84 stop:368 length:285 start_codon:yes stop_codon:yes gene_type:complete
MTKTKNKKMKKMKSGTVSSTSVLWSEMFSRMGGKLGEDLEKRLKALEEVMIVMLKKENDKYKKLEDKVKLLEQKVIDLSSENEGLTRTLSEFVN